MARSVITNFNKMNTKTSYSQYQNNLFEDNVQVSFLNDIKIIKNNRTYFLERNTKFESFSPENRRYLGNKNKLLGFIDDIVKDQCGEITSICDIFAGTGVVGLNYNKSGIKVISNDILRSNYIPLKSFLQSDFLDTIRIKKLIDHLNGLNLDEENYFSENYGGTYFTIENARKIGRIREEIEVLELSENEKSILLTSLIYATDKVANTVGHYDAYRKIIDQVQSVKLLVPNISITNNKNNEVYCEDANELVKRIEVDVLYLDPPYNSRQYSDAYHLLENLVTWKKPEVFGVAKKMNRDNLKSRYCLKDATIAFQDLIKKANCKHILVSYNNTGDSKDSRSNARISDREMIEILQRKGDLTIYEMSYKTFTTGKTKKDENIERVFYCRVTK